MTKQKTSMWQSSCLFLVLLLALGSASSSQAIIRFDDEFPGVTQSSLKESPLANRFSEFIFMVEALPLAALPPRFGQFDSIRSAGATPLTRAHAFLDRSADILLAQFPIELALHLRRTYFNGENLVSQNDLWHKSGGSKKVEFDYWDQTSFRIRIAAEISQLPLLQKIHRLIGIVHAGQAITWIRSNQLKKYRHEYPVLNMINLMTAEFLTKELLASIPPYLIEAEIKDADLPPHIKSALRFDFTRNAINESTLLGEIATQPGNMTLNTLVEWEQQLATRREQQRRALPNEKKLLTELGAALRSEFLKQGSTQWFRLANEARLLNDTHSAAILKELILFPPTCKSLF